MIDKLITWDVSRGRLQFNYFLLVLFSQAFFGGSFVFLWLLMGFGRAWTVSSLGMIPLSSFGVLWLLASIVALTPLQSKFVKREDHFLVGLVVVRWLIGIFYVLTCIAAIVLLVQGGQVDVFGEGFAGVIDVFRYVWIFVITMLVLMVFPSIAFFVFRRHPWLKAARSAPPLRRFRRGMR